MRRRLGSLEMSPAWAAARRVERPSCRNSIRLALFALLLLLPISLHAVPPNANENYLNAQSAALRSISEALAEPEKGERLDDLRREAMSISDASDKFVAQRKRDLAQLEMRAALLGPAPSQGSNETAYIQAQRRSLAQTRIDLAAAIKRGKLIAVSADQLAGQIISLQSEALSAEMTKRLASPLSAAFWSPVFRELPRDAARMQSFMAAQVDATSRGFRSIYGWLAIAGLVLASGLMWPLRNVLLSTGQRVMIDHAPASRLRRSGLALWLSLIGTFIPCLALLVLTQSFRMAGMVSPPWQPLASIMTRAVLMASLIISVGNALLQSRRPSWRLLPIADDTAAALVPWTIAVAAIAFISIGFSSLVDAAEISPPGHDAADLLTALILFGLIFAILVIIGRLRIAATKASAEDTQDDRRLAGVALTTMLSWLVALAGCVLLVLGYVELGLSISRLMLWLPTVAAALYLLLVSVNDLSTELICGGSPFGTMLHDAFRVRPSLITQMGVALSAALRVLLVLIAVAIAFVPFGSNFAPVIAESIEISHGITIGAVTIAPGAIVRAIAVFAAGLFLVRLIGRWLTYSYLPVTDLDTGARNSISTVTRYVGIILATLWALAALGIGFERIALIVSALSVGIGFGLQAITQNFVSGLILLIERPVKIGDLIRVGDQEGDVKRISVRATEIVVNDQSTLIVPNSELITKTVRNMTLADPIGRVQIDFAVSVEVDFGWVRAIVMDRFALAEQILDHPAAQVFLDSLDNGNAHFRCVGYVASPRHAYAIRSDLLFDLAADLREAGINLAQPWPNASREVIEPGSEKADAGGARE